MPDDTQSLRLTLLVQRLLDADLLLEAEGAALLEAVAAARQAAAEGDGETAGRQLSAVAASLEDQIRTGVLDEKEGRPVLIAAQELASGATPTVARREAPAHVLATEDGRTEEPRREWQE